MVVVPYVFCCGFSLLFGFLEGFLIVCVNGLGTAQMFVSHLIPVVKILSMDDAQYTLYSIGSFYPTL